MAFLPSQDGLTTHFLERKRSSQERIQGAKFEFGALVAADRLSALR
jgi:hypothetical protein